MRIITYTENLCTAAWVWQRYVFPHKHSFNLYIFAWTKRRLCAREFKELVRFTDRAWGGSLTCSLLTAKLCCDTEPGWLHAAWFGLPSCSVKISSFAPSEKKRPVQALQISVFRGWALSL